MATQFFTIADALGDGLALIGLERRIVNINQALEKMTGYNKNEIVDKPAEELIEKIIKKEDVGKIFALFQQGLKETVIPFFTFSIISKENKELPIAANVSSIREKDGSIIGWVAIFKDISERKLFEEKLRESETKFKSILEQSLMGICLYQEKVIFVNQKFASILGYSIDEIMNMDPKEYAKVIHPDDREMVFKEISKKLKRKKEYRKDYPARGIKKDGETIWVEIYSKPMIYEGKNAILVMLTDISEKKKAEERLKESEEKYRNIIENMSSGVAVFKVVNGGEDFIFKDVNKAAEKIEKVKKENVIGKSLSKLFPELKTKGLLEAFKTVWKTDVPAYFPVTFVKGDRIIASRDNFIYKLSTGEIATVYDDTTEKMKAEQKLKESEAKYRETLNLLPEVVYELDTDLNVIYTNSAGIHKFGYSQTDINRGLNISRLVPPEELERAKNNGELLLSGKIQKPQDYVFLKKDGERFWGKIHAQPIIKNEKIVGIRGIISDVTEYKKIEKELRDSEEKYRFITENMEDLIVVYNKDLKIEYFNEAQEKLTGYTKEEMLGKSAIDLMHPEEMDQNLKLFKEVLEIGYGRGEARLKRKDGSYIWIDSRAKVITDNKGEQKAIVVTTDVDKQKKLELELKKSEVKYKETLDLLPEIVYESDLNQNIIYANRAALEKFGYAQNDIDSGLSIPEVLSPSELERAKKTIQVILSGQETFPADYLFKKKDGTEFWGRIHNKPIYEQEKIIGMRGVVSDISERKKMETELRDSKQQLAGIIDSITDYMIIVDENHNIIWANDVIKNGFGSDIIGKKCHEVYHGENIPCEGCIALKTFADGEIHEHELDIIGPDGGKKVLWCASSVTSRHEDGSPKTAIEISKDITDRKWFEERLIESEEKFRRIFHSIPDLFFLVSRDSTFLDYSGKEEQLYLPPEKFMGKKMTKVLPADVGNKSADLIIKTLDAQQPHTLEYALPVRGEKHHFEARFFYFSEDKVAIFIRDITNRKEIERKLKESEAKYRETLELLPDAVYELDTKFNVVYANRSGFDKFGYAEEELEQGLNITQIIAPQDVNRAMEDGRKILTGEMRNPADYRFLKKDGTEFWGRNHLKPIYKDGKIVGARGVISDITERKNAEMRLTESEAQYRSIFNSMGDSIHVVDKDLRIILINPAIIRFLKQVGIEPMVIGKQIFEVFPFLPDDVRDQYLETFKTGKPMFTEESTVIKGQEIITETRKIPIYREGIVTQILTIVRNITERKLSEDKITRKTALLNAMNEIFQESMICESDEAVAHKCLEVAQDLTGSKLGFIGELIKPNGFEIISFVFPGVEEYQASAERRKMMVEILTQLGFLDKIKQEKRSFVIDGDEIKKIVAKLSNVHFKLENFLGVPLKQGDNVFGMMALANKEGKFDINDQRDLESLSIAFVEALMRKRAENEVMDHREHLEQMVQESMAELRTSTRQLQMETMEHKKIGQELKETTTKYQETLDFLPDTVFEIDADMNLLYINQAAFEKFGFSREEFENGLNARQMISPKHLESAMRSMRKIIFGASVEPNEYLFMKKDGSEFWGRVHSRAIYKEGKIVGARGIVIDITGHKKMEDELRESERRFRDFMMNLSDGILIADVENRKFFFENEMICEMLGYSMEEIEKLRVNDIHPKEFLPFVLEQFDRLSKNEIITAKDIPVKRKDGSIFYADVNASHTFMGGKKYLVGAFRDVTERKNLEEQLRELSEDLAKKVEEQTTVLKETQKKLLEKEKMAFIGKFTGGISNKMRDPLEIIHNATFNLKVKLRDSDESIRRDLNIMQQAASRLTDLVTSLPDFTKINLPVLIKSDVNVIVQEAINETEIPENINVVTQLSENLPKIGLDPNQIKRSLKNIVLNAIQAMQDGGTLTISTKLKEKFIEISFRDTGRGISEDDLSKIFEPLFSTKPENIGLGLPIVKDIIVKHGGEIVVASKIGEGTTFTIKLLSNKKDLKNKF